MAGRRFQHSKLMADTAAIYRPKRAMEMQTQIYCIIANCYQHESVHVTSLRPAPVVKHGLLENPRTKCCLLVGRSSN